MEWTRRSYYDPSEGASQLPPERCSRGPDGSTHRIQSSLTTSQARRIIVHTSQLSPRTDEGFTAYFATAVRNVIGVRLVSARVPRRISAQPNPAHLVLFSIQSKPASSIDETILHAVQRRQLLSTTSSVIETYSFPTPVKEPWRKSTTEANVGSEPNDVNARITLHTLSTGIHAEASMSQIGRAFQDALKHHTGVAFDKRNSLWNYFIINSTPTGFIVALDPDARHNTLTYGDFYGPFEVGVDDAGNINVAGNAAEYLKPFNTAPNVTSTRIILSLSRPVFIEDASGVRRRFMPTIGGSDESQRSAYTIVIPREIGSDPDNMVSLSFTSFAVPEEVTLDRILSVEECMGGDVYRARAVSLVRDAYVQSFDVQMRLVVEGRIQGVDYAVDASLEHEFADVSAAMHTADMAMSTTISGSSVPDALSAVRRPKDLDATAVWTENTGSALQSVPHQRNDMHQMSDVLFAGHMMNVTAPSKVAMSPTAISNGGGWRVVVPPEGTSTRFIAPAYPYRPPRASTVIAGKFDVSPLVARILNDEDVTAFKFYEVEAGYANAFYKTVLDGSHISYEPRQATTGNSRAVVVMMNHELYRVVSARRVSHIGSAAAFAYEAQVGGGRIIAPGAEDIVTMDTLSGTFPNEHAYWSWVFELDRDVSIPSFIDTGDRMRSTPYGARDVRRADYATAYSNGGAGTERTLIAGAALQADVVRRVFEGGMGNAAALFVPNEYYAEYGRPSLSSIQIAPPTFVVRDLNVRAPASQAPYLTLRGIGNAEIARGSESNGVAPRDILCILNEEDRGDRVVLGGSETRWMSTPMATMDRLMFDFVYADNEKYPIGDADAVLVFDIYGSG